MVFHTNIWEEDWDTKKNILILWGTIEWHSCEKNPNLGGQCQKILDFVQPLRHGQTRRRFYKNKNNPHINFIRICATGLISIETFLEDDLYSKTTFAGRWMEDNLEWKTSFDQRRPSMEDNFWWITTFNGRPPSMKDDLRWKTSLDGRRMEDKLWSKVTFNWRQLLMDNNLQS